MKWNGLLSMVMLMLGCGDDTAPGSGGGGGSAGFSEADVVGLVANFDQEGFEKISSEPLASQHAAPQAVVWVSSDSQAAYRAIDPGDTAATAPPFEVGTLIVKQHFDMQGVATGDLTVMAKMPAGFNADAADWWWGRFSGGELAESGVLDYCVACHEGNGLARTDYVKGVAAAMQTP